MNENTEGSRRGDRHRRHRGRGGRGGQGGQGEQRAQGTQGGREADARRDSTRGQDSSRGRDNRDNREIRRAPREELPPLPTLPTPVCPKCGQPIQDITSALADRDSGEPLHFDCVIQFLQGAENLAANEKLSYIGQGRFAVMVFENPQDTRKFKIVRTIEWEGREKRAEWRGDIAGAFSQVK
jgi:hypothetical protein